MKKCSKCGRPLNEDENDLCPACESTKSHKGKKWIEIGGAAISAVAIGIKVLISGGKGGWKA